MSSFLTQFGALLFHSFFVNPRNDYLNKKNEIKELQIALEKKTFRKKYIEVVNNNIREIYKGWWSEILTLKQWKYYE